MKTRFLLTLFALFAFAMGIRAEIKPYTYYLVGNMNSWAPNEAYEMTDLSGVYVLRGVSLTTSSEFKVVKTGENAGGDSSWFPDGMGNNQTVEADGNYDVYFRPNGDGLATEDYVQNSGMYYFKFAAAGTSAGVGTVTLNGGFNNWGVGLPLTQTSENTWTGVLDMSNYEAMDAFDMKLVVNGGGDEADNWGGWIGWGNIVLNAPAGWLTEGAGGNIAFNHSTTGYTSYNITATWEPNALYYKGWTLTIADKSDSPLAISEENFPDYYFQEYIKEVFDEDNDGSLSAAEIKAATFINIPSNSGISDLTGIKNFTSLEILNCYDNNDINVIDVAGMTSLAYLNCYNNKNMHNIYAAGCTNLEHVDCHKNMEVLMMLGGSLDFTGCTSLQTLYCQGFGVANWSFLSDEPQDNFKISDCTALRQLNCAGNHIGGELDLTAMTNLQRLDCNNCGLSSLKVDGLSKLETLTCPYNNLRSLTVTGCTALEEIECYGNYINATNMGAFVSSLPTVDDGTLTVRIEVRSLRAKSKGINIVAEELEWNENEITTEQVAAAKAKGWNVECMAWDDDDEEYYPEDYKGSVAINAANFPDANLREFLSEEFDEDWGNGNGYLSKDETPRDDLIGMLYVTPIGDSYDASKEIKDLTGIKKVLGAFDINQFAVLGTKVSNVDVSGSKSLETLEVGFNQINSVNVSGCENLKVISLVFNNISGANMDAFISSLPQAPAMDKNSYFAELGKPTIVVKASDKLLNEIAANADEVIEEWGFFPREGNEMTATQVAAAKAKGWRVVVTDGFGSNAITDYEGIADEPVVSFTVDSINYVVIDKEKSLVKVNFMYTTAKKDTKIIIPKTVTYEDVTYTVKEIGVEAFVNDYSVVSLSTPITVETIRDRALMHCSNLREVKLSNGLKTIGDAVFAGCGSLISIKIPGTVKSIGYKCFSNCDALTDIYYGGTKAQWNEMPNIKEAGIAKSVTIHFVDGETENGFGDFVGIEEVAAKSIIKDGKFLQSGSVVIRKGDKIFNAAGQRK